MIPADIAFAMLVNKTAQAYTSTAPTYMTYRELTHIDVSAGAFKKSEDINRSVAVRVADDYAIMRDLPNGKERIEQAFPIIPYFDPMSKFGVGYFANLKSLTITLTRGDPLTYTIPTPDPTVDISTPYFSYWIPHYAPDSTDASPHFQFDQTPVFNFYYPTDITVDPTSGLPSEIAFYYGDADIHVTLNYSMIEGHWIVTHGSFTSLKTIGLTFRTKADITFDQFAFPASAPDPRLSGTPTPTAAPSTPPSVSPSP